MKKFLTNSWTWAFLLMAFVFTISLAAMPTNTPQQTPVVEAECKLLIDEVAEQAGSTVHINVPNDWPDFTKDPFYITFGSLTSDHTGMVNFGGIVDEKYLDFQLYYMIVGDLDVKWEVVPYGLSHNEIYYGIRSPGDCPEAMGQEAFELFDTGKKAKAVQLNTATPS